MKSKIEAPGEAVLGGPGVRVVAAFNVSGFEANVLGLTGSGFRTAFFNKYGLDRVLDVGFNPFFARRTSFSGLISCGNSSACIRVELHDLYMAFEPFFCFAFCIAFDLRMEFSRPGTIRELSKLIICCAVLRLTGLPLQNK
jgi:hypothetical protein